MNKFNDILEDYEKKIEEDDKIFYNRLIRGEIAIGERYPPQNKFIKLQEPIARGGGFINTWGIVPFYGSTIIPLIPKSNETDFNNFSIYKIMGFSSNNIDKYVDMVKETGRIQFGLVAKPTQYKYLDFLEPIFKELKPPSLTFFLNGIVGEETYNKYCIEFDTLSNLGFKNVITRHILKQYPGSSIEYINKRILDYRENYISFKALGHNKLVEDIESLMILNPYKAMYYYEILGTLLSPPFDPLKPIYNWDRDILSKASVLGTEYGLEDKIDFSYDIGKFVLNKLVYYPETFNGCMEIIQYYGDYDLLKILKGLNEGVKKENIDLIHNAGQDLSEILDNIWSEAEKIKSRSIGISAGISVGFGLIGAIGTGVPGVGILSGLGFQCADKYLKMNLDSLSERITKFISPNYLVTVYDIKKKFNIKK